MIRGGGENDSTVMWALPCASSGAPLLLLHSERHGKPKSSPLREDIGLWGRSGASPLAKQWCWHSGFMVFVATSGSELQWNLVNGMCKHTYAFKLLLPKRAYKIPVLLLCAIFFIS